MEIWSREQPGSEALPIEAIDSTRFQLIDHILFSQALVKANVLPRVEAHGGMIEHTIHDRINALLKSSQHTSDHRPVSVTIKI